MKGALAGSVPIEAGGITYIWESSVRSSVNEEGPDIRAYGREGEIWSVELEGGLTWTSVITVTENYLIGTATAIIPSQVSIFGINFPERVENFLILLDKNTGKEIFRTGVPDDASSTLTVGPDGSIFVNMLGLFGIFALEHQSQLGIARYAPVK